MDSLLGYLDRELRFVRVNDQLAAMNGKSAAEHAGRNPAEIVPEIAAGVQSLMRQVLDTGQPVLDLEIHGMTSADPGVPHHWLANYYPLQSEDGEVQGLSVVVADVTERKATEAALRESEERFRVLFDYNPAGVLVAEIGTRQFLFGNREFARMLGYTVEELPQLSVPDLHPPEAMPLVEEHFERMAQGSREPAFALPMRRRDGSVFLANIRAGHVMLGARPCLMGIFEDITARKRLEEERAEALRSLAVVEVRERQRISRELHDQTAQRLVALAVELKSLETNLNAGRSQTTRVTALRKAVDELQQQVRQIAWELRVGELLKGDLREALQEYVEDWSERAQVPVDYACREGDEEGLPAAIKATLYRVAQEALANIDKHAHARRASVLLERDAALVRLTIEDDGCGFDVEAIQHSPEAAQRLGLLGMQERVALVGGGLVIESSPGSGTTILVRIPVLPPVTCSTPTASP